MTVKQTLSMNLGKRGYDITVGSDLISHADKFFDLNRRVLIVTDSGVPREYSEKILKNCRDGKIHVFPEGEASKNIRVLEGILHEMLDFGMQRCDAVVAVGGGVVGDISGFAAACYMRGIDFYNVPTTLLSQVDSSIGGKTAIDFYGAKNIIGAFHQPKGVLIDTDTLLTLDKRQKAAGLAEVIKMSLTSSEELFCLIEGGDVKNQLSDIIIGALKIKKSVVEEDEREGGLRKILNFGHTFGHGIEAASGLYHGECVALGMLPLCAPEVRKRLLPVLKKVGLPITAKYDVNEALDFMKHDKKGVGEAVDAIFVEKIGSFKIERTDVTSLSEIIKSYLSEQPR